MTNEDLIGFYGHEKKKNSIFLNSCRFLRYFWFFSILFRYGLVHFNLRWVFCCRHFDISYDNFWRYWYCIFFDTIRLELYLVFWYVFLMYSGTVSRRSALFNNENQFELRKSLIRNGLIWCAKSVYFSLLKDSTQTVLQHRMAMGVRTV